MKYPGSKEDFEFLKKALKGDLEAFYHEDHVRLAWLLLTTEGESRTYTVLKRVIERWGDKSGSKPFDHDITTRWLGEIARCMVLDDLSGAPSYSFEEFKTRFSEDLKNRK